MLRQVNISCDRVGSVALGNRLGWSRQRMFLVLRRAVTKTGRWCYTRVVRQISTGTGVQQKIVRKNYVRLSLPKEHFPTAKIKIMDKGVPLIALHPKQTKTGVEFRGPGGTELLPSAFKATMPRGHVGIFKRKGSTRLPIKEQYKSVVIEEIERHIENISGESKERLLMEVDRQMTVMFDQISKGARMRRRGEVGLTR